MIPIAGSAYTYTYATMGELIAWIIGWDLILEYAVSNMAVSVGFAAHMVGDLRLVRLASGAALDHAGLSSRRTDRSARATCSTLRAYTSDSTSRRFSSSCC